MEYGVCDLSVVSVRAKPNNQSEQTDQLVYGEFFEVLRKEKEWCFIKKAFDQYESWVACNQYIPLSEEQFRVLKNTSPIFSQSLKTTVKTGTKASILTPIGSTLSSSSFLNHQIDLEYCPPSDIINTAKKFLNAPYLWGGKTHWGIDCSGFTQVVYKLHHVFLKRDAWQQAEQGRLLNSLQDTTPGDLAFFENEEKKITHVGILLNNYNIIHAHGRVRIDKIDPTGIYNSEEEKYTHKLKFIKTYI